MRKILIILILIVPQVLSAQRGKIFDELSMESKILGKEKKFAIYLPPDYDSSEMSYPVLYLLHGFGDTHKAWVQFGNVGPIADKAINDGKAQSMIIVMPEGEQTFFINDYKNEYRFEDYMFQEFIPYIEANYRCRTDKGSRAVAGLSMGGYGAFMYALHYPDMFAACVAMSPASIDEEHIIEHTVERYNGVLGKIYGPAEEGKVIVTDYFKENCVQYLMRDMPDEQKNKVRFLIDVGDDDPGYKWNFDVHYNMKQNGIKHEYRVRDGAHVWEYWRTGLPIGLEFITQSFMR